MPPPIDYPCVPTAAPDQPWWNQCPASCTCPVEVLNAKNSNSPAAEYVTLTDGACDPFVSNDLRVIACGFHDYCPGGGYHVSTGNGQDYCDVSEPTPPEQPDCTLYPEICADPTPEDEEDGSGDPDDDRECIDVIASGEWIAATSTGSALLAGGELPVCELDFAIIDSADVPSCVGMMVKIVDLPLYNPEDAPCKLVRNRWICYDAPVTTAEYGWLTLDPVAGGVMGLVDGLCLAL
jgi:hypothetical protein